MFLKYTSFDRKYQIHQFLRESPINADLDGKIQKLYILDDEKLY